MLWHLQIDPAPGRIDLAGRQISNCSVTMQVKNGDFVRVSPTKPGTFKCWPNGIIERKLDIFGTG